MYVDIPPDIGYIEKVERAMMTGTGRHHRGRSPALRRPRWQPRWTLGALACDRCGAVVAAEATDEMQQRALGPIRGVGPGMCEPEETVCVCPTCGARESLQPGVCCAGCSLRPCRCARARTPRIRT